MASQTPPYPIEEPEVSIGELIGRLTEDFGKLVQDHIRLAKEEITAEVKQAGVGAGLLGGGAVAGWIAALLLSFTLAWGLAEALQSVWLGFFITGLLWATAAAALMTKGRKELRQVEPKPEQTMSELEEDKRWLREQTS